MWFSAGNMAIWQQMTKSPVFMRVSAFLNLATTWQKAGNKS